MAITLREEVYAAVRRAVAVATTQKVSIAFRMN
jgi:hypothetical protein